MPVTYSTTVSILKHGKYYYPANKHYGGKGSVNCDRYHRSNLISSIGYNDLDLCLKCVSECENRLTKPTTMPYDSTPITFMVQSQFDYDEPTHRQGGLLDRTLMMQEQFQRPYGSPVTKMLQKQFNRNKSCKSKAKAPSFKMTTNMMQEQFQRPYSPPATRMLQGQYDYNEEINSNLFDE